MRFPWSKKEPEIEGTGVTFTINARMQPMHRVEAFEMPLLELIEGERLGEFDGGGTFLDSNGEVTGGDIVIYIAEPLRENIDRAAALLESLGAPRGSHWQIDDTDEKVPFGTAEGLGLYLNGTDLPDEVYANEDVNELIDRLVRKLGADGTLLSNRQGPTETALYFYGPSFAAMADAVAEVVADHPLAQQSRTVQIA